MTWAADEDGAGAAVALGADHLGAGELEVLAEERGQGDEGGGATDFEAAAVDVEEDVVSHDFANVRARGRAGGYRGGWVDYSGGANNCAGGYGRRPRNDPPRCQPTCPERA